MLEGWLYTSTIIHVMHYEPILICDSGQTVVILQFCKQSTREGYARLVVFMRVIIQYIFLYIDMNAQVHKIQDVWYVTRKGNKKYHGHLRGELSGEPNGLSNLFRRRSSSCCSVNAFCL